MGPAGQGANHLLGLDDSSSACVARTDGTRCSAGGGPFSQDVGGGCALTETHAAAKTETKEGSSLPGAMDPGSGSAEGALALRTTWKGLVTAHLARISWPGRTQAHADCEGPWWEMTRRHLG